MKRASLLVLGYYLYFQAGIGALNACGSYPEYAVIILPLALLSGWSGYKLIQIAKNPTKAIENAPTKELPVPDTQPLDRK